MSHVVISYRRQDSLKYTERLYDRIRVEFGEGNVFRDLDSISFGTDFRETIDKVLSNASVLLAVIGPDWVDARDARGNRRLDNPFDFVRVEIARALVRKVRVIPVLVGGASMPTLEEVPEELRPLLPRQAFPLLDQRFNQDLVFMVRESVWEIRVLLWLEQVFGIRWWLQQIAKMLERLIQWLNDDSKIPAGMDVIRTARQTQAWARAAA